METERRLIDALVALERYAVQLDYVKRTLILRCRMCGISGSESQGRPQHTDGCLLADPVHIRLLDVASARGAIA